MKLNADILNFVMMVQSHFKAIHDENIFYNRVGRIDKVKDAFEETEKFFNAIDKGILKAMGLTTNKYSFNKVLYYQVTCEMTATLFEDLGQFEF